MITRLPRLHSRKTARAIEASALALVIFSAAAPAAAQVITADPAGLQYQCTFVNSPNDCGFYEESFALPRASIVTNVSRDGTSSVRLHTQPGDSNVTNSGGAERDDLSLSQGMTSCYAGQEHWWAHSILFPDDYVPSGGWGAVVFDFHNTSPGPGQASFEIDVGLNGMSFSGYGGAVPYPTWRPPDYSAPIGPVVKNVWYDFVYHVRWSPNSDGFFYAWVNGVQKLAYTGPTLYTGQGCYLKLANYHTPTGLPSSVIHDRVLRGSSLASVSPPAVVPPPPPPPPPPPVIKRHAISDFDGDGKSDILWFNSATGQNSIWFMNGATLVAGPFLPSMTDLNWKIAGVGDFDGDGKADILWRNALTGQNHIWIMNGGTVKSDALIPLVADLNWKIAGVGDFDGDGKSDILWRNSATGQNSIWFMNGASLVSGPFLPTTDLNWKIAGVGDFDGDGKSDILWRNALTGQDQLWIMNGGTVKSDLSVAAVADLNWKIAGVGDFDGDGKSDILWHNSATGQNSIWFMNGATLVTGPALLTTDLNWKIAGVGDFAGDGKSDIVWRNALTGQNELWAMNGSTLANDAPLAPVADLNWKIAVVPDTVVPINPLTVSISGGGCHLCGHLRGH